VIESEAGLTTRLADCDVNAKHVASLQRLALTRPDLIIVGPDVLGAATAEQTVLYRQAEAGANVAILAQQRPKSIVGYARQPRSAVDKLACTASHPLLCGVSEKDLSTWAADWRSPVPALSLPAGTAALEVVYWPPVAESDKPVALDVLVAEQRVGKGRVIFCQLPVDEWTTDPRAQTVIANICRYLATQPVDTPPRHLRQRPNRVTPRPENEIPLKPGAR
jgi:hypothetical protein